MNILYAGYFCSEKLFMDVLNKGVNNMSFARQRYEKHFLRELNKNCKLTIASYIPVSDEICIDDENENFDGNKIHIFGVRKSSFLSIIRQTLRFNRFLTGWLKENTDPILVFYSINPIFLIPAVLHRIRRKFKIIGICSELPHYKDYSKNPTDLAKKITMKRMLKAYDAYILFAEPMKDYIESHKPYTVLEGFADSEITAADEDNREKVALYAGGLAPYHGVRNLLEAFSSIEDQSVQLWICGNGTTRERDLVLEAERADPRIRYFGAIPNSDVIKKEKISYILINPASNTDKLANYAFPSKILEYMASGTPVLTTKLDGIPNEYDEFLNLMGDNSPETIRDALISIFSVDTATINSMGRKAQLFILENKVPDKQIGKALTFIGEVLNVNGKNAVLL